MCDQFVVADKVGGVVSLLVGLGAGVFVRRGDQPAAGSGQKFAHANLMFFSGAGETGVVYEIDGSVIIHQDGVVALRYLDVGIIVAAPLNRAHQSDAGITLPVVTDGARGDSGVAGFIDIRTGDVLGTEHADLVAAGLLKVAI